MYYPQLVAGPIERPQNLLHQFRRVHSFKFSNFYRGLRLIVYGFYMKLVVADRLAIYVDSVYNNSDKHSGVTLTLATFFFSFQIYCDFAGYSSIAIGVSRIMGISLMTNFRRPYLSTSVAEFWRRWHISLSTWFKDYLYISLGGNRVKSKLHGYFNVMITFLVSGLWHGANWTFVIWGGLNGLYLIFENTLNYIKMLQGKNYFFLMTTRLYIFLLISVSWIFFRSNTVQEAFQIIRSIIRFDGKLFLPANPDSYMNCFFSIFIIMVSEIFFECVYVKRKINFDRFVLSNLYMLFLIILILLIGVFDGGQFIYFQF